MNIILLCVFILNCAIPVVYDILLGGYYVNNTTNVFVGMYIVGQRDYMFRPVEATIRSVSFDAYKSTLYNYMVACVMWRSRHQGLFCGYNISRYCI